MKPLCFGVAALAIASSLTGCVEEQAAPIGKESPAPAATQDSEAPAGFGLVVPTETDMVRLRIALASQKLGRMTAVADAFVLGYHAPTPYANDAERVLDQEFLSALYAGRYDRIGELKERFGALIPQNSPGSASPLAVARMGFLNIWEFGERYRMLQAPGAFAPEVQQDLLESIGACNQYFHAAVAAAPNSAVYRGFASICALLAGQAPGGEADTLLGLVDAADSIRRSPEFNLFTIGYALTSMAPDSKEFQLGLEMLYRNLDVCFDTKINRENPDVAPYLASFTPVGNKRFCFNTEKSAHNFEGFFLIMGDMLVKANKPAVAKIAYTDAKLLPSYHTWPYKQKLEERLAAVEQLVVPFQKPVNPMVKPDYPTTTFNTEYTCMACHQKE